MVPGLSLLLDVLRVLAATTVVFGHMTQSYFSTGWPGATRLAIEAVAVFFVLSGFVIRHTTLHKDKTLARYAVSRAARIYSVVLPALILTVGLDEASRAIDPAYYLNWEHQGSNIFGRLILSVMFLGQAWTLDLAPLSNSPFWSLNYECVYYAAYGAWFYLGGRRRALALAAVFLVTGPKVFLLFPIWLLGVWLYDHLSQLTPRPRTSIGLVIAAAAIYAAWFALRLPERIEGLLMGALGPRFDAWLGPSRHIADFYVVAIVVVLAILGANGLMSVLQRALLPLARPIRGAASATFSIYLYHFPLLVFFASVLDYDKSSTGAKLVVFALVLACCFGLSRATEARKDTLARLMKQVSSLAWRPRGTRVPSMESVPK